MVLLGGLFGAGLFVGVPWGLGRDIIVIKTQYHRLK